MPANATGAMRAAISALALILGGCYGECPTGLSLCGGHCLDLESNVMSCGACGNECGTTNACVAGICTAMCVGMEVSTAGELEERLADLSWVSQDGTLTFLMATEEIEIQAADIGTGYMFESDHHGTGISLSGEILYGFEDLETSNCSWPLYPTTASDTGVVPAGTSFVASVRTWVWDETMQGSCPAEYHCSQIPNYAYGWDCCCTVDPFEWRLLSFREPPAECLVEPPACGTELAGFNHSRCYDTYLEYAQEELGLHSECIGHGSGFVRAGDACTCRLTCQDQVFDRIGVCGEDGTCEADLSCLGLRGIPTGCV